MTHRLATIHSSARYEQPRMRLKLGQRAFSYAASAAWNSLPPSLQQITNTDWVTLTFDLACR